MPVKPTIGSGMQFKYQSAASPQVFTSVKGVQTITPGSSKNDTVDVTDTDSGQIRAFIPGLSDNGDVTIVCNYLPGDASQVAMKALFDAPVVTPFEVIYPGGLGQEAFSGIVTSIDRSFPTDKELKITYKIKISGVVTVS